MNDQMSSLIPRVVHYFEGTRSDVLAAYLFGSHAKGSHRDDSDVDVAVLLPLRARSGQLMGPLAQIRGDLERRLGRTVDIVDLRSAPVDLVHRILREGILLIDRDPEQRATYEVAARNAYFDLLPYIEAYRSSMNA